MKSREVSYEVGGTMMIGHLAVPDGAGPFPGVLICHEGTGIDDFQRERADRLARMGMVAFALDYHGGGKPLDTSEQILARVAQLAGDTDLTRAIASAALAILTGEPLTDRSKLAAIGYCFGGTMALELARGGADLRAVVGFHSGLATRRPADASNIHGSVLVCIGSDDPFVPPAQREAFEAEMRAGGVDWRMNVYGGVEHGFTRPGSETWGMPGLRYDAVADARSWRAMLDLFDEAFARAMP